jgi:hypothetical protein
MIFRSGAADICYSAGVPTGNFRGWGHRRYNTTRGCWNPVRRGLLKRPEDWKWSSFHECVFPAVAEARHQPPLRIDRVRIPADGPEFVS